jgi:hypothetical protein
MHPTIDGSRAGATAGALTLFQVEQSLVLLAESAEEEGLTPGDTDFGNWYARPLVVAVQLSGVK